MSRPKLTVTTIVYDEETLLPGMLLSVANIADDIVIGIDSRTTDRSEKIARLFDARIFRFDWCDDFSAGRNLALDRAKGDWILSIDADERLTPFGASMIKAVMRQPDPRVGGYCFETASMTLTGHVSHTETSTLRLWAHHPQTRYTGRVYEHLAHRGVLVKAGILRGGIGLMLFGGDPVLYETRQKGERYLRLLELQRMDKPNDRLTAYLIAHQQRINGQIVAAAASAEVALAMEGELSEEALAELHALARAVLKTTDAPGYATTALIPKSSYRLMKAPPARG